MIFIKDIIVQQSLRVLEDIESKRSIPFERIIALENTLLCMLFFDNIYVFKTHNEVPVEESVEFYNRYFKLFNFLEDSNLSELLEGQALDYFFEYHKPNKQEVTADENGLYNAIDAITSIMGDKGYYDINRSAKQAIDNWLLAVEKNNNYCVPLMDSLALAAFQWKQFATEKLNFDEKELTEEEKQLLLMSPKIRIPDFVDYMKDISLPKEDLIKKVLYYRNNPSFILIRKQLSSIISSIECQKFKEAIEVISDLPGRFDRLCQAVDCNQLLKYELSFYPTNIMENKTYRFMILPQNPIDSIKELKKMFPINERFFNRHITMQL